VRHAKTIGHQRQRRRWRVSNKVKRYSARPRLAVFRSHMHIYAQVIDDAAGRTLATASSLDKDLRTSVKYGGNREAAVAVGKAIAQRALAAGVTRVALDRRDYKYHGRVAALADAARDAGLDLGAKKPEPEAKAKPEPQAKKPAKKPKKPAPAKEAAK
jgi:large subunit ribosomal protein L18